MQTEGSPHTLQAVAEEKLSKDKLQTANAVLSLGLIVVKELDERGVATVFINEDGEVELALPGEIELDELPEDQAMDMLLDRNYEEEQIVAYLRGRTARKAHRGQNL